MQVFAQGDQPAAAPSPLNSIEALLLAQLSLINGALPEAPGTIGGIQGSRGSDHHAKTCQNSMGNHLKSLQPQMMAGLQVGWNLGEVQERDRFAMALKARA